MDDNNRNLILAMVLTAILLCLEDNVVNRWIFIIYAFITNMNMYLFYGITGMTSFHTLSVGNIPNSVIIAGVNTIILLGICIYLIYTIIKDQYKTGPEI